MNRRRFGSVVAQLARASKAVGRLLASGPVAGALAMVALCVLSLATTETGFRGMGDPAVIERVLTMAQGVVVHQLLLIVATMAAAGAAMGTLATLWGRARGARRFAAARGVAFALVGHVLLLARSMVHYPQLYSSHYYGHGGWRRAVMVFLTDHVPVWLLDLSLIAIPVALFVPVLASQRGRAVLRGRTRDLVTRMRRHPRAAAVAAAAPLAVVALVLLAAGGHPPPRRHPERPNVLIIAIDALRPDRVYGDDATRFPTLSALARRGVRFQEAYVSQARTFPSLVSLFTGRESQHHGIRHEFGSAEALRSVGATLPATLSDAGWRTAVVSDFSGDIFTRAPLGFDDVDAPEFHLGSVVSQQLVSSQANVIPYATSWLGQHVFPHVRALPTFDDPDLLADRAIDRIEDLADQPFFLMVFFSSPHPPYTAPDPYYRSFTDPGYRGPYRYLKEPLPMLSDVPPEDVRQVHALYDGAVLAADRAVARVLAALDRERLGDDTIIVLLGDHGENLFDVPGRGMGHGDHLWGRLDTHIPLVLVDPRDPRGPRDVTAIVRGIDVAPTLAARLGVPAPEGSDGVDLTPLLDGSRTTLDLDAYSESGLWFVNSGPGYASKERLPYPDLWNAGVIEADGTILLKPEWEEPSLTAKYRAVRTAQWKLVYQPTPAGARWRLFDVVGDPAELDDVAAAHPDVVAELRPRLERWITADGKTRILPDASGNPTQ